MTSNYLLKPRQRLRYTFFTNAEAYSGNFSMDVMGPPVTELHPDHITHALNEAQEYMGHMHPEMVTRQIDVSEKLTCIRFGTFTGSPAGKCFIQIINPKEQDAPTKDDIKGVTFFNDPDYKDLRGIQDEIDERNARR